MRRALKFKKLILCLTILATIGLFLSSKPAFGADTTPPNPPTILSPTVNTIEMGPVTFRWTASDASGIKGYSFLLNNLPNTTADIVSEGLITDKTYFHLENKTYYLHVAALDNADNWSGTTHFKLTVNKIGFLLFDFEDYWNGFGGESGYFADYGGWCDVDYEVDPEIIFGGQGHSLELSYATPQSNSYAGIWTSLGGNSLQNYKYVSLWVRGESGGEKFLVGLRNSGGYESKVEIDRYLPGGVTTEWQKASIPFTAFGSIQGWQIMENFSITFLPSLGSQGTIYVDNIFFEKAPDKPTSPIFMIDDYNDAYITRNSLGFLAKGEGSGLKSIIPSIGGVLEVFLHRYDNHGSNNAKKIIYDVTTQGSLGSCSSNVWDDVTPLDISNYKYISFHAKRGKSLVGQTYAYASCYLKILYGEYGSPDIETPPLDVTGYFIETDEWQLVNVPLADFTGLDKTKVRAVVFYFDNKLPLSPKSGTLYVDNLQFSNGYGKPESTGPVRIDRETKKLFVGNRPFVIKGVGYQPTPIGSSSLSSLPSATLNKIFDRDLPLLKTMGCNTIKTWGIPSVELMNKASEYGLKVIATFYMPNTGYDGYFSQPYIKALFTDFIIKYKDLQKDLPPERQALLMWALGNENNYRVTDHNAFYNFCNELAEIAYRLEGSSYHPVMIVNGDLFDLGVWEKASEDSELNYIDVWGANAYHKDFNNIYWTGNYYDFDPTKGDLENFFELYKEKSTKPLVITEYGADAFHTTTLSPLNGYEDEKHQADWVKSNASQILAASETTDAKDTCLGSALMAYSDEWWKDKGGNASSHDLGPAYFWGDRLPDGYANEEWWGIMEIEKDGTWPEYPWNLPNDGLDDIKKREVYDALKELFYTESSYFYGDVSGNGLVNTYDASLVAQYAVGLINFTDKQIEAADVSGENGVNTYDASLIAQYAVGLIDRFPIQ